MPFLSMSRRTDGIGGSRSRFSDASGDGRSGHGAVDVPQVVIGRCFSVHRGEPRRLRSRCHPPRFPRAHEEEPQQREVTASPSSLVVIVVYIFLAVTGDYRQRRRPRGAQEGVRKVGGPRVPERWLCGRPGLPIRGCQNISFGP